jgi:hypothetical protein
MNIEELSLEEKLDLIFFLSQALGIRGDTNNEN